MPSAIISWGNGDKQLLRKKKRKKKEGDSQTDVCAPPPLAFKGSSAPKTVLATRFLISAQNALCHKTSKALGLSDWSQCPCTLGSRLSALAFHLCLASTAHGRGGM